MNQLKDPYLYSRDEFNALIDEYKPKGADFASKPPRGRYYELERHIERVKFMSYDVHQWLLKRALDGDEEALWKLDYGYNIYSEVISKAKEENKI